MDYLMSEPKNVSVSAHCPCYSGCSGTCKAGCQGCEGCNGCKGSCSGCKGGFMF